MDLNTLFSKVKDTASSISNISKDKLKYYVRDKAYKNVIKKCIEEGIDIEKMEQQDLEYLLAEEETKIYEKIKGMGIGAIMAYLGMESLGSI